MDLISRKAAIEAVKKLLYETAFNSCGHHQDDEIYADIADNRIEAWLGLVPSVHAVPLDKLCEWLERNAAGRWNGLEYTAAGWKDELTRWMEQQNAVD